MAQADKALSIAETRHEEIRRFLDAAQDPKMTELVSNRGLGPEQEEYQARLSHLCLVKSMILHFDVTL